VGEGGWELGEATHVGLGDVARLDGGADASVVVEADLGGPKLGSDGGEVGLDLIQHGVLHTPSQQRTTAGIMLLMARPGQVHLGTARGESCRYRLGREWR